MSLGAAPMACRSFEYRNSDWGGEVQLHDSTCGSCELPVVIISDTCCAFTVRCRANVFHVVYRQRQFGRGIAPVWPCFPRALRGR
ncbi:hypothetical protein GQ600_13004 [Phytophthora cactorum]|nr:hypothetical protein GQ600_13004 [Phytophthora cactorum]